MKILLEKYPLGSLKNHRTPGRYINATLKKNIDLLAKNVTKDMTWLGIISSSTLEVGTGKSVFAQQFAEAYLDSVNQYHGFNLELTMNNIVFQPKDIIERSFKVPQYSVVICDEWEDEHYWSELGITLRQFFRKCRQLNLLIIVIIPNFFQLPMSYAISRSIFFIDVKFSGEFDRGFFDFYSFRKKKYLYLKGKKQQNYDVTKPDFDGGFVDGYVVDEQLYRREKRRDLEKQEEKEKKPITERQMKQQLFKQLNERLEGITILKLAKAFRISERTAYTWLSKEITKEMTESEGMQHNIKYPIVSDDIVVGGWMNQ